MGRAPQPPGHRPAKLKAVKVGDGRLPHPGAETIVEAYYSLAVIKGVHLTLDSQTVFNPAYDRDRGPAEVLGLRLHAQY